MSRLSNLLKRRLLIVALLGVIASLISGGVAIAQTAPSTGTGIVFSTGSGTVAKALSRANVAGTIDVALSGSAAGATQVDYYLDDVSGAKEPLATANSAPFRLGRVDTTKLRNGKHSLLAVVTTATGKVDLFARFAVKNAGGAAGAAGGATGAPAAPKVKVGTKEVWRGDFETGDFTQWHGCEGDGVDFKCGKGDGTKFKIVNGARQGKYAAQFTINSGDTAAGGERVEVQNNKAPGPVSKEGDEFWFEWSTKFEPDFKQPTGGWFSILQWHDSGPKPPVTVGVAPNSDKIVVTRAGNSQDAPQLGTVRRGQWTDFVLHIKFSGNDSEGFIEGWENGKATLPRYNRSTLITGENYLKMGIYRDRDDTSDSAVVTHDGMRITAP